MYGNYQAIYVVTFLGGVVVAPGDSVVAVCIVVCFAWLFVMVFGLGYAWINYERGDS